MNEIAEKVKELYEDKEYEKVIEMTNPYIATADYENGGIPILMYSNLCMFYNGFYSKKTDLIEFATKSEKVVCLKFPNFEEFKEYFLTISEKIVDVYCDSVNSLFAESAKNIDMPDCKMAVIMSDMSTYYSEYKLFRSRVLSDVIEAKNYEVSEEEKKEIEEELEEFDRCMKIQVAADVAVFASEVWEKIENEYIDNYLSPNNAITMPLAQKVLFGAAQTMLATENALYLNDDKNDIDTSITNISMESAKISNILLIISSALEMYLVNGKKVYIFFDDPSDSTRSDLIKKFDKYAALLKKLSPEAEIPQRPEENPNTQISNNSGGCYVATCVYGSYDCPQVWTLRRYRDNILASTWHGRAFIKTYYAISPTLVKWFGNTNWFKSLFKGKLDRMVKDLNSKGIKDSPYKDK